LGVSEFTVLQPKSRPNIIIVKDSFIFTISSSRAFPFIFWIHAIFIAAAPI
jgi:hypothetical protein